MYCIIKCIVQGKQAHVKNANLRHPSSMCSGTVSSVMRSGGKESLIMNGMLGCCRLCSFCRYRSLWLARLLSVPKFMSLNLSPQTGCDLKYHCHLPAVKFSGSEPTIHLHLEVEAKNK